MTDTETMTGAGVVSLESARKAPRRKIKPVRNPNDPRPTIRLTRGDIERIVDESERALIKADRGLYQRDSLIVSVVATPGIAAHGREIVAQRIAESGDYALLEHLGCAAHFIKFDKRENADVVADPPLWIVKTLRERKGKLRFPVLTGVINAPTLREDAAILDAPGYDLATGLLFDPQGVEFPFLPDRPTRNDATAALALLRDLIGTFPFVGEVDRAVALSAILTALVRRSLPSAPLHAFSSPVAGSGKSKLVDIASVIATGREAGVIAQGKSKEEFEKRLGAVLLAGDPIIAIDNCEAPLGGVLLCQCLSQRTVQPRILGQSRAPETSTGAFIAATGNNLLMVGDLTRRAIMGRLDAKHERPETRLFARDPVAYAKGNRPALVAAALTILHAYNVAGRPGKPPPLGSFEAWSDLIRGALLWLGSADPVDSMESVRASDPIRARLAAVMSQWQAVVGSHPVTVAEVISRATERRTVGAGASEFAHPDLREALLIVACHDGAINSGRLGKWLSANKDKIEAGLRFRQAGTRQGFMLWELSSHE
jgi:putative DNA primase/helicase